MNEREAKFRRAMKRAKDVAVTATQVGVIIVGMPMAGMGGLVISQVIVDTASRVLNTLIPPPPPPPPSVLFPVLKGVCPADQKTQDGIPDPNFKGLQEFTAGDTIVVGSHLIYEGNADTRTITVRSATGDIIFMRDTVTDTKSIPVQILVPAKDSTVTINNAVNTHSCSPAAIVRGTVRLSADQARNLPLAVPRSVAPVAP